LKIEHFAFISKLLSRNNWSTHKIVAYFTILATVDRRDIERVWFEIYSCFLNSWKTVSFCILSFGTESSLMFISTFVFKFIDHHCNFAIDDCLEQEGNRNECKKIFYLLSSWKTVVFYNVSLETPFSFLHFPFCFHWHRWCCIHFHFHLSKSGQVAGPVMMSSVYFSCPKTALGPNKVQPLSSGSSFAQNEK